MISGKWVVPKQDANAMGSAQLLDVKGNSEGFYSLQVNNQWRIIRQKSRPAVKVERIRPLASND
jgi:plasmid maintenance system killer protein